MKATILHLHRHAWPDAYRALSHGGERALAKRLHCVTGNRVLTLEVSGEAAGLLRQALPAAAFATPEAEPHAELGRPTAPITPESGYRTAQRPLRGTNIDPELSGPFPEADEC